MESFIHHQYYNDDCTKLIIIRRNQEMKYVHVQSVLPQEDVIALKAKTGESSVKEAISKAVYYYLKYAKEG